MTEGEYLDFERRAQVKHEYVAGEVFAMAGASLRHNGIVANLMGLLSQALRGGPCRVFPSDLKVHIASRDIFTYPDVSIVCGDVTVYPGTSDVLTNPKVLFEVLSDSTERYDRGDKAEAYRTIPSLSAHVLLVQQRAHIECYSRQDDGGWILRESGPGGAIAVPSLSLSLEIDEVYRGVFELPS